LQLREELLRVRTDLHRALGADVLLYLLPRPPVQLERFKEAFVLRLGPSLALLRYRVRLAHLGGRRLDLRRCRGGCQGSLRRDGIEREVERARPERSSGPRAHTGILAIRQRCAVSR
jgi:hypothetical protein